MTPFEEELRRLSAPEAPKVVSKEIPGPKAKEILNKVYELETVTLLAPYVNPFVWSEARGATIIDPDGNVFIDMTAGIAVNAVGHNISSGSEANEESYYSETIHGQTIYYKQRVHISRRLRSAHYPLYPIKGVGIVPAISALILKPFAQLCADESLSAALTSQQTPLSETTPQMFC